MVTNMSAQPELTELLDNLEDLPPHEVRYMCAKLGVDQPTLDKIDADHRDALTRIPKYFLSWLDRDSRASWTSIVEVLKSKRLNKWVLADKIMTQYCPSVNARSGSTETARLSSKARSGSSSHESSPSSDSSSLEFESLLQHDANEGATSDHREVSPPPTLPESKSKPERHMLKHIAKTASDLEIQFLSVVSSTSAHLTKTVVSEKLQVFKSHLIRLPLSGRYKKLHFLKEKKEEIRNAQSVEDIFDILDDYWNYVDYSLLEHIVKTYCDRNVKREMKQYKRDLKKFEKATSVKDYTLAVQDNRKCPSYFSVLSAKLKIDAAKCTLHHVRKIKKAIARKASLQRYAYYLQDLQVSSVAVTFAFPQAAHDSVEQALDKKFLKKLSIVPESVHIDGVIPHSVLFSLERSPPDVSPVQEEQDLLHSLAMPDPPKNVTEELTYTIRSCDLKPVYGHSEPQLMTQCNEIKSKTQTSIQFQWRSDGVEFHIAGLEQGVTRAVQLVREEFEEVAEATSFSSDEEKAIQLPSQQHPTALTEEALREHEALTSPSEVRQFSCKLCLHDWWRVVPAGKPVSRCRYCNGRYDALLRDKEYGICYFTCPNCGYTFYKEYWGNVTSQCRKCSVRVSGQYIKNNNYRSVDSESYFALCSFSTPHVSTGSTVDTWLSQTALAHEGCQEAVGCGIAALVLSQPSQTSILSQRADFEHCVPSQTVGPSQATAGYGQPRTASGYPHTSPTTGYGRPRTASGYPHTSPTTSYGRPRTASGYSHTSPTADYGHPRMASGYTQTSPILSRGSSPFSWHGSCHSSDG